MLFNSIEFAIFFPIVVGLYFGLPRQMRLPLLLVSSCIFYMAFIPAYILILFLVIVIDYWAGIQIEKSAGAVRRLVLLVSIASTCGVLFVFKYYNFFLDSFRGAMTFAGVQLTVPHLELILPIGLSFHTFQSLSYVIEVYRRNQKAERNFLTYSTYVMFFPQLVAGPIERPQNLLHQFKETHSFDYGLAVSGLKLMAWGFFKKLVVADRLALYVNDVYANPRAFGGFQLTLATIFFAYQIYCDFSGYTDIARGSARVLGFRLMKNFDHPYCSTSISEFWKRWHISLSTWFRDYIYIPLGGSRRGLLRSHLNLIIVFLISGLWHGANWTFVAWGILNGIYLIFGRATQNLRQTFASMIGLDRLGPLRYLLAVVLMFVLTCAGWILFRAKDMSDAYYILTHFWRGWSFDELSTPQFLLRQLPVAIASIVFLELVQWIQRNYPALIRFGALPVYFRWTGYCVFVVGTILFGVYRSEQFIYFQF